MCRHLAYLGRPRTIHELVYARPHSLRVQAYAPRMSENCLLNADGFGVGWYQEGPGRSSPLRYRRAQPIWNDVSFEEVATVLRAGCLVAAVRSATLGFPADESCAQPFRAGRWLFSHNGRIDGFAGFEGRLRELAHAALTGTGTGTDDPENTEDGPAGGVPDGWAGVADARAPVDSALLFALAVGRWRAGAALGDGLAEVVAEVRALTGGDGPGRRPGPSRLNLLAADGRALAATACGDTLFARADETSAVIASEPYDDDPAWRRIPDGSVVTADAGGLRVRPLWRPAIR
jgi:glutamine amidotransferase